MLNHIIIMGRIVHTPELRYTKSETPVCSFSIASERDFSGSDQKETDFVDVTAWRRNAEFVSNHFSKGSMIIVEGRLQMRKYTDKNGNNRTAYEIAADRLYFGESKRGYDADEKPPVHQDEDMPPERDPMPPERDLYNDLGGYNNVRYAEPDDKLPWE